MKQFIYCYEKETFNKLVNEGFIPLKDDCKPFVLLNKENMEAKFEDYNVKLSDVMCF